MSSFGLSIIALAAMVAPGVLFIVSFFSASLIKRTSISFGPAIDIAVFSSLSLVINGVYGGCVGWLIAIPFGRLNQPRLLPSLTDTLYQFGSSTGMLDKSSILSASLFCYVYLVAISIASVCLGICCSILYDLSGVRFANSVLTRTAQIARRRGVTICSALCKFGGDGTFVIYIGEIKEIVLNEKNEIGYILIRQVRRSVLHIEATAMTVHHSLPEQIPGIEDPRDEFKIPGASIENIAFRHFDMWPVLGAGKRFRFLLKLAICGLFVVVPPLISLYKYHGLITQSLSPAAGCAPAHG